MYKKALFSCLTIVLSTQPVLAQEGQASFYAKKFNGRQTANGETFDNGLLTAAHRSLPFGTWVKVTNQRNGRSVKVRINDRGPFAKTEERIIDLSRAAAGIIDIIDSGLAPVTVTVIRRP